MTVVPSQNPPAREPSNRSYSDVRWQLIVLGLFRFSEAIAWTTVFPYAYFMMQSFLPDGPSREANAAALSSLTVSLFTFGEFLMSICWARISDRIGRKPTFLIGVVGSMVSALAFGLSSSWQMALAARTFGGLINPNVGTISTCVGELIKKKDDQGKAFSVVPFLRGLGSLIGPVIGGYLFDQKKLPSIFQAGSLWKNYPYLLPNLVVVIFIGTSGFLGFFFVEETNPRLQGKRDIGRETSEWLSYKIKSFFKKHSDDGYQPVSTRDVHQSTEGDFDEEAVELEDVLDETHQALNVPPPTAYTVQVMLQILAVSLLAFHKVSSDVIIPMFLATPSEPSSPEENNHLFKFVIGFGMTPADISNVLLSQAIIAIVAQLQIVPRVITRWGALKCFRWSMVVFPFLYCLTPFTAKPASPFSMVFLLLDLWIKGVLSNVGYVTSAILLTNTTPSPEFLATIHGAAASLGCLARSVGSGISGEMFRLGLQYGYMGMPFWTLGVIAVAGASVSLYLRDEP